MAKEKAKSSGGILRAIIFVLVAVFLANRTSLDNLKQIYPWILLWTPFREETLAAWKRFAPINHAITYPPRPIPEIRAEGI
jgi:hypothetical protein